MNTTGFDIRRHVLPILLAVVLLLQVELTLLTTLLVVIPLLLVSIGIHQQRQFVGLAGLLLFFFVSLPYCIPLLSLGRYLGVILQTLVVITPSILLLNQVLTLGQPHMVWRPQRKPLLLTLAIVGLLAVVLVILAVSPLGAFLFTMEAVRGQILLVMALSLIGCVPLLVQ